MTTISNVSRIPIGRPDIGQLERANVEQVMQSGWLTQGRFVAEAEERLKKITGRKHAILTSSGTMALMVSILVLGKFPRGRRIIPAPALTFAAVHNAIRLSAADVHMLDADPETWQVAEQVWDDLPMRKYSVIVTAPCYGRMDAINVRQYSDSALVIEDAAESFGGLVDGKPAGSFGDVSVISFYANKICTAGEGGAILTDDQRWAIKLRTAINHGIPGKDYVPRMIGLNGRSTDIAAAILCAQLERMDEMMTRRRKILQQYCMSAHHWNFGQTSTGQMRAPWLFAAVPPNRLEFIARCDAANIEWRPFFFVPEFAIGPDFRGSCTEARKLSESGVCLPLSSALTDDEVNRVCEVLRG